MRWSNARTRNGVIIAGRLDAEKPRDPRSRRVLSSTPDTYGHTRVQLECGHSLRRRFALCVPERAICEECPNVGGVNMREHRNRP